jgi:hypothetical protein
LGRNGRGPKRPSGPRPSGVQPEEGEAGNSRGASIAIVVIRMLTIVDIARGGVRRSRLTRRWMGCDCGGCWIGSPMREIAGSHRFHLRITEWNKKPESSLHQYSLPMTSGIRPRQWLTGSDKTLSSSRLTGCMERPSMSIRLAR